MARCMDQLSDAMQRFSSMLDPERAPSALRILESMDAIAWTFAGLLVVAVGLGIFFTLNTRRTFLMVDDVETSAETLLARLQQDPTRLPPRLILSRLGADATRQLLEYGDRIDDQEWIYKWGSIRNELLYLLGQQDAFAPTYALAQYYQSTDKAEPDTLRIRRTALIHKLGLLRFLEPNADGVPAELRIRCHPSEVVGDLGFAGETLWLMPDEPAPPPRGPLVEMDPIDFHTLERAELHLHIRRTPMTGGGFRLQFEKRRHMWIVVDEEIEWAS